MPNRKEDEPRCGESYALYSIRRAMSKEVLTRMGEQDTLREKESARAIKRSRAATGQRAPALLAFLLPVRCT